MTCICNAGADVSDYEKIEATRWLRAIGRSGHGVGHLIMR